MKITPGVTWASGDTVNHTQLNAFLTNATVTSGTLDQVALGENALDSLTSGADNVGIGDNAGTALTSGHSNVAVGNDSLKTIPEGYSNVAVGEGALSLGAGSPTYNVAVGQQALEDLSGAVGSAQSTSNVAIGHNVGKDLTTGASNTLVGVKAGELLTTDSSQNAVLGGGALSASANAVDGAVAVGYEALKVNEADINTAVGYRAGVANTSGDDNTFVGSQSGYSNQTGTDNTLVGDNAGYAIVSGGANVVVGSAAGDALTSDSTGNVLVGQDAMGGSANAVDYCTAAGFEALKVNTADNNVGVGYRAGVANTSGGDNTFVGNGAGYTNSSGGNNTFIGDEAGYGQTGSSCTSIGATAGGTGSTSYTNATCIGAGTTPLANNEVVIGSIAVTWWRPMADDVTDLGHSSYRFDDVYATNGTIQTSDKNLKKNVKKSNLGLAFLEKLNPVSYSWKKGNRKHYGMIAQEVEKTLDGEDFAGLVKGEDDGKEYYGLRYGEFIAPLIKAVQELSAKVAKLEAG